MLTEQELRYIEETFRVLAEVHKSKEYLRIADKIEEILLSK
jgi:hypothetical protein